jgi:hypothetical protein
VKVEVNGISAALTGYSHVRRYGYEQNSYDADPLIADHAVVALVSHGTTSSMYLTLNGLEENMMYRLTTYHNVGDSEFCGKCFPITLKDPPNEDGELQQQSVRVGHFVKREDANKVVFTFQARKSGRAQLMLEHPRGGTGTHTACEGTCSGAHGEGLAACNRASGNCDDGISSAVSGRQVAFNGFILETSEKVTSTTTTTGTSTTTTHTKFQALEKDLSTIEKQMEQQLVGMAAATAAQDAVIKELRATVTQLQSDLNAVDSKHLNAAVVSVGVWLPSAVFNRGVWLEVTRAWGWLYL